MADDNLSTKDSVVNPEEKVFDPEKVGEKNILPGSKEESDPYAEGSDDNKPAAPVDASAHIRGWTNQDGPAPQAPESVPGNVVLYEELPYKSSLESVGIDPAQYRAGLTIAGDESEMAVLRAEVDAEGDKRGSTGDNKTARRANGARLTGPKDGPSADQPPTPAQNNAAATAKGAADKK